MKAMQITAYGENAIFEPAELEKPEVKPGHVLVKIAASSVNTVDTMIRRMGKDLPFSPDSPAILGMDFSGTVESVGEGVKDYSIGDEVYGCAGGLAKLNHVRHEDCSSSTRSSRPISTAHWHSSLTTRRWSPSWQPLRPDDAILRT